MLSPSLSIWSFARLPPGLGCYRNDQVGWYINGHVVMRVYVGSNVQAQWVVGWCWLNGYFWGQGPPVGTQKWPEAFYQRRVSKETTTNIHRTHELLSLTVQYSTRWIKTTLLPVIIHGSDTTYFLDPSSGGTSKPTHFQVSFLFQLRQGVIRHKPTS